MQSLARAEIVLAEISNMAVLVTRPHPDDETTAEALRARGFGVLRAPMLRFEPVPFQDDADAAYGAVIVTSANALRAIAADLADSRLLKLPLFAVGENTAARGARRRLRRGDRVERRCRRVARSGAFAREVETTQESPPDPVPCRGRSRARPCRRTWRERLYGGDADHLPDGACAPTCRERYMTLS